MYVYSIVASRVITTIFVDYFGHLSSTLQNLSAVFHIVTEIEKYQPKSLNPRWEPRGVRLTWRHISRCVGGGMSPGCFLDLGSLKQHFQHFEVPFEQNIKVSNHIVNSVSHHIFKKYFGPNEIILTFSVSLELHEIVKLNMADIS